MCSRSAALRIGHISSNVENVFAENLEIYDTNRCIAVFSGNSGSVRNVKIKNVASRSRVYAGWWGKGEPFVVTNAGTTGKIVNVSISGITAESDSPALIIGDGMENKGGAFAERDI